jgi:hypothetical protein
MYSPLSPHFLETLSSSYTMFPRLEAWLGSELLDRDIPVESGEVNVQSGNGSHRTLTVTIPDPSYWAMFEPVGIELRPFWCIQYLNRAVEEIPLGVFVVEEENLDTGFGGKISISSAPDRWVYIMRARFEKPRQSLVSTSSAGEVRAQILRLMLEAKNTPSLTTATNNYKPPYLLIWDRDRTTAINNMAASAGIEVFYDFTGRAIIRDEPKLSNTPVWSVNATDDGVFIDGQRKRSRQRTYNVVVVFSTAPDGLGFPTQIVADTDPTSPTWVGGPMGRVPYFFPNAVMANGTAARKAGVTRLNKVKSKFTQLSLTAQVNPALGEGDVIMVTLPDGTIERHLVDSFNVPLTIDGDQRIETRTSRPFGDVPDSE